MSPSSAKTHPNWARTRGASRAPIVPEELLQRAGVALVRMDADGVILEATAAASTLLEGAAVGRPLAELVHPADYDLLDPATNPSLSAAGANLPIHVRIGSTAAGWRSVTVAATNLLADPEVAAVVLLMIPNEDGSIEQRRPAVERSRPPQVDALPVVAFESVAGDPFRFAYISSRVEALVGYPAAAFVEQGRSWHAVVHPDDRGRIEQAWSRITDDAGPLVTMEYRVVRHDGSVRRVRDDRVRKEADHDEAPSWHGVLLDITSHKTAGADLRPVEARSRRLLEHLPAGVYIQETAPGSQEHNTFVNQRLEDLLGYAPQEWSDDRFWASVLHPEDRDRVLAAEEEADTWLSPFCKDYRIRARDGRTVWVRDEARPLEVTAEGRQRWLGVMVDISETMAASEALRKSEQRFKALVQHSHDIIAVVDPDGAHRYVSPSLLPHLGHDPDEFGPEAMAAIVHPDDLATFKEAVAACARDGGQTPPLELRLRHRDGSWRLFEAIGTNQLAEPAVAGLVFNSRDVTERRAIERSLRESERRFERFMAIIPAPAAIKDRAGRFVFANEPFRSMFGDTAEREGGLSEAGQHVLATGEAIERTETIVGADGVERELLSIRFPIDIDDDRLVGLVAHDTTERKRAEEAQRLLAAIVTAADDAIVARALDGTILSWNPGAERLFGYSAEEMIGKPVDTLIPTPKRPEHEAAAERARGGERVGPIESQRLRRDGALVDVRSTLAPLLDQGGQVAATVEIAHDFTGPKRVREALRRANEDLEARVTSRTEELSSLNARLTQNLIKLERAEQALRRQAAVFEAQARLLELAHDAIVVRTIPAGTIEFWNPSAAAIYGWSREEAIGEDAQALLETRFPRPVEEIERRLFASGHWEGELEQRRRDGSAITVESRWAVRRDEQGTPVAILEINRDATDRMRTERERRELYAALQEHARRVEELAQLKDDFSSIVAHELVTPVAAIRWFVEVLQLGGLGADEINHALATIKAETDLLHLLVDDVRAIAKIDRDDYAVGPKPTPLAELFENAISFARSLPGNHPFEARVEASGEVLADRARIGQVLRNLLGNAAKYTPPGTPIVLRASESGTGVWIEVADEGPGIHPDDAELIFEKYRRGRQPAGRQVAGAGVGLYVSRRIVQAHGSDLTLRTAPGAGANFAFELRRPS